MTKPYNVDIQFDDFCKECKLCEIDINETELTNSLPLFEKLHIYHIKCKNREVCRMWVNKQLDEAILK